MLSCLGQVAATRLIHAGHRGQGRPLLGWNGMSEEGGCGEGDGEDVTHSAHTDRHTRRLIKGLRHTEGHTET